MASNRIIFPSKVDIATVNRLGDTEMQLRENIMANEIEYRLSTRVSDTILIFVFLFWLREFFKEGFTRSLTCLYSGKQLSRQSDP